MEEDCLKVIGLDKIYAFIILVVFHTFWCCSNWTSEPHLRNTAQFKCQWSLCWPLSHCCTHALFFASPLEAGQGLPPYFVHLKNCYTSWAPNLVPLFTVHDPNALFRVSVCPLRRLQRHKMLKLARLSGELGSVTNFHIAKLAHTQFEMFWFAKAYDFLNSYPLPHFKPSLVQAYWGLQLQKEAELRNATGLDRLLKIQVSRVRKRFCKICAEFSVRQPFVHTSRHK